MTTLTRRGLLTGLAGTVAGKKKRRRPTVGMQPDQQGVFFQVIIQGGGEFTYDAAGNLRTANVGQTVTDPIQGITCYQGINTFNGHGAVISLNATALDAQLLYKDTGTSAQGALIWSNTSSSTGGTDPFGNFFQAGETVYNSAVQFVQILGSEIVFQQAGAPTISAGITDGPAGVLAFQSGNADGADVPMTVTMLSKETSGIGVQELNLAGVLVVGTSLQSILQTDAAGYPQITDNNGLTLNESGCQPANSAVNPVTGTTFASLTVFAIPAGNAEAGALYEIEVGGFGTQGSGPAQVLNLQCRLGAVPGSGADVVGVAFASSVFANAGDSFQWSAKLRAQCVSSGAAAKWRLFLTGVITDTTTAINTPFAVGTGAAANDVTLDSTAAINFGLSAKWTANVGGPTISKSGSQFGRRS